MNPRASRRIPVLVAVATLWLAAGLLAAPPSQAILHTNIADPQSIGDNIARTTADVTVLTVLLSNEAPGRLIDRLIAQGYGDDTLYDVLSYLKAQSGGVISDAFHTQVTNSPAGMSVFTTRLSRYAGIDWGVCIAGDGDVHEAPYRGSDYAGAPGYVTTSSQDRQFTFTAAQDAAHYLFTASRRHGSVTTNYYAFAIAWRQADPKPTPSPSATYTPTASATPIQPVYLPLVVR